MASSSQHIDVLLNQLNFHDKNKVKVELSNLEREFKGLVPRTGVLTRNDGTIENVLVLGGTIPIFYEGVQYNIPLDMFLLQRFPNQAPEIYIRPTSNMTIKKNHRNVDIQGLVYLPYLHSWSPSSSVVQLVYTCSSVFSKDPPLFAKPITPSPPISNLPRTTQAPVNNAINVSMASIYSNTAAQNTQSRPAHGSSKVEVPDHLKEKREKDALVSQITGRLQEEILLHQTRMKADIEQEFRTSQDLKQSEEDALKYSGELQKMKESIITEMSALGRLDEELEAWRASKETTLTSAEEAQRLLDTLEPYDELSAQLVQLQGEQNAIDDALYYLEKAMRRQSSSVTLETFLSKTRQLANRQFLCRAHIRKIEGILNSGATSGA